MRARTIAAWLTMVAMLLTGLLAGSALAGPKNPGPGDGPGGSDDETLTITFSDDCRTVTVTSTKKNISYLRADHEGNQTNLGDWDYINEDIDGKTFTVTFDDPVAIAQAKAGTTVVTEECNPGPPPCEEDPSGTPDTDGDGVRDECDPCPDDPDDLCTQPTCEEDPSGTPDTDGDGQRDECDPCPTDPTNTCNDPQLTCRANLLGVNLGGEDLPNIFEANPQSKPCVAEQDGLLVALSPILGDGGAGLLNEDNQLVLEDPSGSVEGFILVDAAWADTDTNGTTTGDADSGVLFLTLNDGTGDQVVIELLTSSSSTECGVGTTREATVLSVELAGTPIEIPGGHTVLITPELNDVIEAHLEDDVDEADSPDNTGAQAVDAAALMDNVFAQVADSESDCA